MAVSKSGKIDPSMVKLGEFEKAYLVRV